MHLAECTDTILANDAVGFAHNFSLGDDIAQLKKKGTQTFQMRNAKTAVSPKARMQEQSAGI